MCGFRKGFSAQNCLIVIIEKWRPSLNSGRQAVAVLTDISKSFDCIDHELLIAKLNAYGFDNSSLTFVYSYLSERQQKTKINSSFSSWAESLFSVPQSSILRPLSFYTCVCDLLFEVSDLKYASFVDDTTPYTCLPEMIHILEKLKKAYRVCLIGSQKTF